MSKWREYYDVHPAADVFPMMSDEELAALGANILENGVRESIKTMYVGKQVPAPPGYPEGSYTQPEVLIDGRNRLEAMERAGIDVAESCIVKIESLNPRRGPFDIDPTAYIISKNIHRRHLNKQDRADLIVAAVKAGAEASRQVGEVPKRHVNGKAGSEKDATKAAAVAAAAEHGISKRTIERAIAKDAGKEPRPAPVKATTGITAARRAYLACFAELGDLTAMDKEVMRLHDKTTAIRKAQRTKENNEDAA